MTAELQTGAAPVAALPPLSGETLGLWREEARRRVRPIDRRPPPLAAIVDCCGEGPAGAIAIRRYMPLGIAGPPVLVFVHGGGFVMGDLDTHDGLARHLAAGVGAIVIAVDYRRAPEHPYPAATEDVARVFARIAATAATFGGDPDRIALVGDSAGGCVAACVALQLGKTSALRALALAYPVTDYPDPALPSYRAFGEGPGLTADFMATCWQLYSPGGDPDAAPLRHASLAGLPPTLVMTAAEDVLRDEGERFAVRAQADGVETTSLRIPATQHGFLHLTGELAAADAALSTLTAWLRERLAPSS